MSKFDLEHMSPALGWPPMKRKGFVFSGKRFRSAHTLLAGRFIVMGAHSPPALYTKFVFVSVSRILFVSFNFLDGSFAIRRFFYILFRFVFVSFRSRGVVSLCAFVSCVHSNYVAIRTYNLIDTLWTMHELHLRNTSLIWSY